MAETVSVLVIDDMPPVLQMLRTGLNKHGYRVSAALSGPEGLELFEDRHFDVIICDLGMPSMNGWEVGRRMKESCDKRGIPKVPFILLTGWGGQMDETDKISESYVDAVLEKPIDIPDLVTIIGRVVSGTSEGSHDLP